MMRAILLASLLGAVVPAQTQVTAPNIPVGQNVDRPFPGGIGRYQQWFSPNLFTGAIAEPMRFEQIEFFAGSSQTSTAAQIDCELLIGDGKFSGLTGTYDSNWDNPPIVAKPRAMVQLNATGAGGVAMTFPFTTRYTWDRVHPILIEIRVHGNSLGNQPFNYNFRGALAATGQTARLYAGGSVGATSGTTLQGVGMVGRFQARPGAVVGFGPAGCAGEGGFVPVASVVQVPSPGITWTHNLTQAASQRACLWIIGDSNTAPFPVDLVNLLYGVPSTCFLTNNFVSTVAVMSVGGGAGAGFATVPIALPATTSYVGVSVYTQWLVIDPLAPVGGLSMSNSHRSIVAPVGG
jgi:hypothetical protein